MTVTSLPPIRDIDPDDAPRVHALSQAVGWPHREEDLRFLLQLGHGVAAGEGGAVDACAVWWPFGPDVATIGLVIVHPSLQGKSLGRALMQRLLEAAGPRRVHLYATEEGRALYERQGFVAGGMVWQHQGVARSGPHGAGDVRPARPEDRSPILALDAAAIDADRTALLDGLTQIGQLFVHEQAGRLRGFTALRPFGRGRVLGPVVAETAASALALLRAGVAAASGTFLRLDTPTADEAFRQELATAGLAEVATALPMIRGGPAQASGPARIYGLAAQALG